MAIETAFMCGIGIIKDGVEVTNFRHMRLQMDNSVHMNKKNRQLQLPVFD